MAEFQEKTEKATPRRKQKAREKGQIARSRELISMASTAGMVLMFYFSGNTFMSRIEEMMRKLLGFQYGRNPEIAMKYALSEMMWILMPFLAIAFTFALFAGALQGGLVLKPLSMELERLNPLGGIKRLFSTTGLVELLKSLFKFIVGGFVMYLVLKNLMNFLPFASSLEVQEITSVTGRILLKAILIIFLIFFIFAVLDYFYQRWSFERSLKMTREEVKQEFKETEGDPIVKSRIKSIQRELARKRMMQEVPKATVVITNPTHLAVALKYVKDDMAAPLVIAKGAGYIAEKIKEIARNHRIPIIEDKPLARALYKLEIDTFIPPELYRAVAKIIAYIYKLRGAA
ncbi:MAG: flagellar biosynthesis protein FlhB [Nitrospirae bacterium]|nr:flagellar biosynthesis protein FlhB [Nitrospirota bacterium]